MTTSLSYILYLAPATVLSPFPSFTSVGYLFSYFTQRLLMGGLRGHTDTPTLPHTHTHPFLPSLLLPSACRFSHTLLHPRSDTFTGQRLMVVRLSPPSIHIRTLSLVCLRSAALGRTKSLLGSTQCDCTCFCQGLANIKELL